jgi:hypothetical protein
MQVKQEENLNNITFGNKLRLKKFHLRTNHLEEKLAWIPKVSSASGSNEYFSIHVDFEKSHVSVERYLKSILQKAAADFLFSVDFKKILVTCDYAPKLVSKIRTHKGLFYGTSILKQRTKVEREFLTSPGTSVIVSGLHLVDKSDLIEAEEYLSGQCSAILLAPKSFELNYIINEFWPTLVYSKSSCKIDKVTFASTFCDKGYIVFMYSPVDRVYFDVILESNVNEVLKETVQASLNQIIVDELPETE